MFDGGVGLKRAYFNLSTKSQFLVKDIENIMKKVQIKPDYTSDNIIPSTGVFELRIWNKEKLRKILNVFIEPNTIKWSQLNNGINALKV
jgi:hypothetical protein